VRSLGVEMLLVPDTSTAAEHAMQSGFIIAERRPSFQAYTMSCGAGLHITWRISPSVGPLALDLDGGNRAGSGFPIYQPSS
jgi:hypothetical protein